MTVDHQGISHSLSSNRESENRVKFSIVVASYNYEGLISRNLKSLVNQSFKDFEIIVVDDGSRDGSVKEILLFVKEFNNVRLYFHPNKENRGLIETLKLAISRASGDFICFCEADDYWDKEHLYFINEYLKDNPSASIIANEIVVDNHSSFSGYEYYTRDSQNFLCLNSGRNIFQVERCVNRITTFSAVTIKREVLIGVNWDSPIPKYIDYWIYRQLTFCFPVYFCEKSITYWYKHDDSYDAIGKQEKSDDFRLLSDEVIKRRYPDDENLNSLTGDYVKRFNYSFLPIDRCGAPLVSIVIPFGTGKENFLRALDSVIAQSYNNIEIVVVSYAGNHKKEVLQEAKACERVTILERARINDKAMAKNEGLLVAHGEYIAFLDPDDYLDQNFVEQLVVALVSTRADTVMSSTRITRGRKITYIDSAEKFSTYCFDKLLNLVNNPYSNKLYRLEFLKKNKLKFPEGVAFGDALFMNSIANYSNFIISVDSTYYNYTPHNAVIGDGYYGENKLMCDALFVAEAICDLNKNKIVKNDDRYILCNFIVSSLIKDLRFISDECRQGVFDLLIDYGFLRWEWTDHRAMLKKFAKCLWHKLVSNLFHGRLRKKHKALFLKNRSMIDWYIEYFKYILFIKKCRSMH